MKFKKTLLATLAITFAGAAFAQGTQSIPVPASSVDTGGRAVRAFTIPVVPPSPSVAEVQQIVSTAVAASSPRAWTTNFIGQSKWIATTNNGHGFFAYIDGSGAIQAYNQSWGYVGTIGVPNVNGGISKTFSLGLAQPSYMMTASPTGFSAYGGPPTAWVFTAGQIDGPPADNPGNGT